jgi:hypothetical protein
MDIRGGVALARRILDKSPGFQALISSDCCAVARELWIFFSWVLHPLSSHAPYFDFVRMIARGLL